MTKCVRPIQRKNLVMQRLTKAIWLADDADDADDVDDADDATDDADDADDAAS